MIPITPEQRLAIEQAGGGPVRLDDPETNISYVLIRADRFEAGHQAEDDEAIHLSHAMLAEIDPEDWVDASRYEP